MALKTFVKASRVSNLSDARYCAGMGVDVIGFNLVPDTRHFVTPEKFSEITDWLSGVAFAGEFDSLPAEEIRKLAQAYQLQYIQVKEASLLPALSSLELPLILLIDMDEDPDLTAVATLLETYKEEATYFLFESRQEAYDTARLEQILSFSKQYPVLLGYGISPEKLFSLLEEYPLAGVALMGEEEIRAGYKDFDKLAEILELLEVDEFED